MGWVLIVGLSAAVLLAMWRLAKFDGASLQLVGAAMFAAIAGYSIQGLPGLPGRPLAPPPEPETSIGVALGSGDPASAWLDAAARYHRAGDERRAADTLRAGVRARPRDADLWIGYGNALVIHADGRVVPAARLAFERAGTIVPDHPALPYFQGLALAQEGKFDDAERIWQRLLATAPPDAEWRPMVEARLASLPRPPGAPLP